MVRKLFHTNHPSVFLSLFAFAIITRLAYLLYPSMSVLEGGYFFDASQELLLSLGFTEIGLWIIAIVLSFIQAVQLNVWLVAQDLIPSRTYLPAFFYLASTGLFSATAGFHAPNVAMTLIIPAFNSVMYAKPKIRSINAYFFSGFFLGLAALFYLPSALFLPTFLAVLFSKRIINSRAYAVMTVSFLMPVYFLWTYFLLTDQTFELSRLIAVGLAFDFSLENWQGYALFSAGIIALLALLGWFAVQGSDLARVTALRQKMLQFYLFAIPTIPLLLNSFKGVAYSGVFFMAISAMFISRYYLADRLLRLQRVLLFLYTFNALLAPWMHTPFGLWLNGLLTSFVQS